VLAQLIPLATGIIISPLPIVAIVAILLSARGRVNGIAYSLAFTVIGLLFTLIAALGTTRAGAGHSSADDVIVIVLTAVVALGFTVLAVLSWLSRPRTGAEPKTPGWLAAVDTFTPAKAAGLGSLMALTNSKNIPLELKAGAVIGAQDLAVPAVILLAVAFGLAAGLGVLLPTILAATGSTAITNGLARLKAEMIRHNSIIMTVLFAILAAMEVSHLIQELAK
jgi:hypothetical protein